MYFIPNIVKYKTNKHTEVWSQSAALSALAVGKASTMAASSLLFGDGVTDDTPLHIASFLPTAGDLLRLQLTNKPSASRASPRAER